MDMKKDVRIPDCGDVPFSGKQKRIVGAKQIKKALQEGRAKQVILAENADPAVTDPLADLCRQQNIQPTWVPSMRDLGRACGIAVGAAAAAVVGDTVLSESSVE